MRRKGNCWGNAVAERFFLNLKMSRVGQRRYAHQAEAKRDMTDDSVGFYNSTRLYSVLCNLSPVAFERLNAEKYPQALSAII